MNGSKACAIRHLRPDHFRVLEAYFQKWSGVAIAIEPRALSKPHDLAPK
jgi:hypothetical protein